MHDVEVGAALGKHTRCSQAEGPRLGKARRPRRQQLEQIDTGLDFTWPRDAEGVRLAVQIEAGHFGQPHPRVEYFGVGLPGEDLDVMAQLDKAAAQVTDVDALPTAV